MNRWNYKLPNDLDNEEVVSCMYSLFEMSSIASGVAVSCFGEWSGTWSGNEKSRNGSENDYVRQRFIKTLRTRHTGISELGLGGGAVKPLHDSFPLHFRFFHSTATFPPRGSAAIRRYEGSVPPPSRLCRLAHGHAFISAYGRVVTVKAATTYT